jgi:hypothetical protein
LLPPSSLYCVCTRQCLQHKAQKVHVPKFALFKSVAFKEVGEG